MVCGWANLWAAFNCGTWVVSGFSFRVPLEPPPVRSVPAVTLVMLPEPVPAQAHALPFHCKTWPLAQLVVSPTTPFPLVPPPTSPDPAVTPALVPAPRTLCPHSNLIHPF